MYTCHGNDALHPTHRLSDLPIEINGAAAQTKRLTCRCGVVTQCKIAIQQFKKNKKVKNIRNRYQEALLPVAALLPTKKRSTTDQFSGDKLAASLKVP